MALPNRKIVEAIDTAPLNRGLKGADWLAHPRNIPVTFNNGDIALFDGEGDGTYEGHYLFVSRGSEAFRHAQSAIRTLFTKHNASLIFGMVPIFRRDVKLMTRRLGFKSYGDRWTPDGACELFILSRMQWKVANS